LQYINNNINNIDYVLYRKLGHFIGSGAIESGNKIVLQRRLKHGGMRWNIESAQAVLSIISKRRSKLWETEVVEPINEFFGDTSVNAKNAPIQAIAQKYII
jgi:hypothetical protein